MSKFIALDFGAESGRAVLGKIKNEKLSIEELHRFANRQVKVHGHIYWDLLNLFDELKNGLAKAANNGHKDISGVGVDTWGVDFGLVDRDDHFIGNPYAYRDPRTDGVMDKAFEIVSRREIYEYTGIQFMQLNSIFQLFSMVLSDHPWLQIARRLLFMPDLIAFLMTGEKNFEYTMASTSQLLNARSKTWETNLFAKLGLPIELMSSLIQPGTVAGKLLREVADDTGMPQVDVIAPGSHDTASAVAAVPAKGSNWAYLSSGTWSLLGIETQEPIISKDSLKYNFTNEGGIDNTIRFLRNTMGLWLLQGCRKSWARQGTEMSYAELVEIANDVSPFTCIIDPDDPGFLNPADMPTAILEYCSQKGQKPPQSKGEFVRSIFESLALKYRHIIERINSMREESIETLHIVGGGSQNEMLNQFAANATGLPVIAGPVEATAIGNILVQAIAKNELHSLQEGRELVANSFPLKKYKPRDVSLWNEFYETAKEIFIS